MSEPNKVGLGFTDGVPTFFVRRRDRTRDIIWDAVEAAISSRMTVEQFKAVAAEAWADTLRQHARWAEDDWRKP